MKITFYDILVFFLFKQINLFKPNIESILTGLMFGGETKSSESKEHRCIR